jgi:WD40 repeat protein
MKKHVSEKVVEHLFSMHKLLCTNLEAINNKIDKLEQRLNNLDKITEQKKQFLTRTHLLHAHSEPIISVTPLQNGGYLSLSLSKLMIWDSPDGNPETIRDNYMSEAIELKDGSIVVAMGSGILKRWGKDKKLLGVFKGHMAWVNCVTQLRDETIVSGSLDRTIRFWNSDGVCLNAIVIHEYPRVIRELSDENIACGTSKGEILILNKTGHPVQVLKVSRTMKIYSLIQLQDSRIAASFEDYTIRVLNMNGTCDLTIGHNDKVNGLVQLDDKKLVSCSQDRTIRLWDIENKQYFVISSSHKFTCLCQLKDGTIVTGSEDGMLHVWKMKK